MSPIFEHDARADGPRTGGRDCGPSMRLPVAVVDPVGSEGAE
jgi:hypothetical protein